MSTDAFAAAVGRGATHRPTLPGAIRAGLVFGVIEAITPVIGRAVGQRFGKIAELLGGLALVALGWTILLEHLGVLGG